MRKLKKVRIACYDNMNLWILGKFARKLNEELNTFSVKSDIARLPDPKADINHHVVYLNYQGKKSSIDTLMITHIDSIQKLILLKRQLKVAKMGICMSFATMQQLVRTGIKSDKLYYINPAHDGVIKPRPTVIGITSKIYRDNRKKANLLLKLAERISPDEFMFKIMGDGWQKIVDDMQKLGFKVDYYKDFDYDKYIKLVPSFDYFLYFGFDEGSMGFIDALTAGVKTIVTPQGYHLDAPGGITYPVKNLNDITKALNQIAEEKRRLIRSVSSWTWKNYALEHIKVWECLLNNRDPKTLHDNRYNNKMERARVQSGNFWFYLLQSGTFRAFWLGITSLPVRILSIFKKITI